MKTTYHNPPIKKEITITVHRKWWEFWNPKTWEVVETHYYGVVIDCEGESIFGDTDGH